MSLYKNIYLGTRVISAALAVVWAGIHLYLSTQLIMRLPTVGYFFLTDGVLAVISAIVLAIGFSKLYLPVLVLWYINYILLAESRIYPAPFLGIPLRVINMYVIGAFVLDILLIILITVTWLSARRLRK